MFPRCGRVRLSFASTSSAVRRAECAQSARICFVHSPLLAMYPWPRPQPSLFLTLIPCHLHCCFTRSVARALVDSSGIRSDGGSWGGICRTGRARARLGTRRVTPLGRASMHRYLPASPVPASVRPLHRFSLCSCVARCPRSTRTPPSFDLARWPPSVPSG